MHAMSLSWEPGNVDEETPDDPKRVADQQTQKQGHGPAVKGHTSNAHQDRLAGPGEEDRDDDGLRVIRGGYGQTDGMDRPPGEPIPQEGEQTHQSRANAKEDHPVQGHWLGCPHMRQGRGEDILGVPFVVERKVVGPVDVSQIKRKPDRGDKPDQCTDYYPEHQHASVSTNQVAQLDGLRQPRSEQAPDIVDQRIGKEHRGEGGPCHHVGPPHVHRKGLCGDGGLRGDQAGLGDDSGHPDVNDSRAGQENQRREEVHAGLMDQKQDIQQAQKQAQNRCAIREDLLAVVDRITGIKGLQKDVPQVALGHPKPPENQAGQRAETLPGLNRLIGGEGIRGLFELQTHAVDDVPFHHVNQEEEPDAEEDLQVGEVGKAESVELQRADPQRRRVARELEVAPGRDEGDIGDGGEKPGEGFPEEESKRQKGRNPEELAPHQGRPEALRIGVPGQFSGYGDQWVHEFLVLDPLLSKDDHHTRRPDQDSRDEAAPPHQRDQPDPPGSLCARRQPLVEHPQGLAVGGHHPGAEMGVIEFGPLVFGGGEVERGGDDAQEKAGNAGARDNRPDNADGHDCQKLRGGKSKPLPTELEQRIEEPHQEEEEGQERKLKVGQIEPGGLDDRFGISHPEVGEDHNGESQSDCPECDPTLRGWTGPRFGPWSGNYILRHYSSFELEVSRLKWIRATLLKSTASVVCFRGHPHRLVINRRKRALPLLSKRNHIFLALFQRYPDHIRCHLSHTWPGLAFSMRHNNREKSGLAARFSRKPEIIVYAGCPSPDIVLFGCIHLSLNFTVQILP